MTTFTYKDGILFAEDVSLEDIAIQNGTPSYVYSKSNIEHQWIRYDNAFSGYDHMICYAVKANSNLAVLSVLSKLGSGFDIVSVGELERVIRAGGDPSKIVFSGVGKRIDEIQRALQVEICCFNVESEAELERINAIATSMNVHAPVSLRVNPNVDARTHPHITTGLTCNKFGVGIDEVVKVCKRASEMSHVHVIGVGFHIGSQMTTLAPFEKALKQLLGLINQLKCEGLEIQHIDVGGGLGIVYKDEDILPSIEEYANVVRKHVVDKRLKIIMEPGRSIVGNAGVLLTKVEYLKSGPNGCQFVIVDSAMNDLIRPVLYDAWHDVKPVRLRPEPTVCSDVVGPICESADALARNRRLRVVAGDLLAICSTGAYGFSLSSQYNSRPRAAELMVDGNVTHVIRERETVETLMEGERVFVD